MSYVFNVSVCIFVVSLFLMNHSQRRFERFLSAVQKPSQGELPKHWRLWKQYSRRLFMHNRYSPYLVTRPTNAAMSSLPDPKKPTERKASKKKLWPTPRSYCPHSPLLTSSRPFINKSSWPNRCPSGAPNRTQTCPEIWSFHLALGQLLDLHLLKGWTQWMQSWMQPIRCRKREKDQNLVMVVSFTCGFCLFF